MKKLSHYISNFYVQTLTKNNNKQEKSIKHW